MAGAATAWRPKGGRLLLPSWLPVSGDVAASPYADFTTEGTTNHYWYNKAQYGSFAALLTALSGTFSRSSTAYYTNSAGVLVSAASGALRFDYDPVTLAAKGILLEGARTNLLLQSRTFQNASWTKQTNVTATDNAVAGPDGTTTAARIDWASASANTGIFSNACTVSTSANNSKSIYIRADVAGGTVKIADANQGVGSTTVTLTTAWQRVSLIETQSGGVASIWIKKQADSPNTIYLSDGQVENATFVSSIIPTTSASVTRAADSLITASSPWFASPGTLYANWQIGTQSGTNPGVFEISDSTPTFNRGMTLRANNGVAIARDAVTLNAAAPGIAPLANVFNKSAFSFDANYHLAISQNGGTVAVDATNTVAPPGITTLFFGQQSVAGSDNLFGWVKEFAYFRGAASNAELIRLTQ